MGNPFWIHLGGDTLRLWMNENIDQFRHNWDCRRHSNADYELHIILNGSCDIEVEDKKYALKKGQAILIAPGQYHCPNPNPGAFERFSMSFSLVEGQLETQLRGKDGSSVCYVVSEKTVAICRDIFGECTERSAFSQERLQLLLTDLMIQQFRYLKMQSAPRKKQEIADHNAYFARIDDFFEVNMAENVGAEKLAEELHLSRRQLARILQQTYGMGFREKLIRTRMDHASWLLRNTRMPVSRIVMEVGYASEAAFFQAFRSRFETTPQQYRARYKNQSDEPGE